MAAKILIVDDDHDLRSALAVVLSPHFTVFEAAGGTQALSLLAEVRPDLTLLDVSMPDMSGLEVLATAKARDPQAMIVMLTSHQDIDLALLALNAGAVEYITKPFDAEFIRAEAARLTGAASGASRDRPWKVVP